MCIRDSINTYQVALPLHPEYRTMPMVWYIPPPVSYTHLDVYKRQMLLLTTNTGCQGRNGGGWAHYVGQEKIRPIMGFQHLAFALDWHRPPRHMNQTAYWYVNTSQYRYDTFTADELDAGTGVFAGKGVMDLLAQSVRLGWTPVSYTHLDVYKRQDHKLSARG